MTGIVGMALDISAGVALYVAASDLVPQGRPRLTSGVWAEALEDGDKIATRLIDRAVLMLAAGVASVRTCSTSRPS